MALQEVITAPIEGAQIDDLHRKLLIYEESENELFSFREVKSHGWTFYDHIHGQVERFFRF